MGTLVCTTRDIGRASIWHFSLKMWLIVGMGCIQNSNISFSSTTVKGMPEKETGLSMEEKCGRALDDPSQKCGIQKSKLSKAFSGIPYPSLRGRRCPIHGLQSNRFGPVVSKDRREGRLTPKFHAELAGEGIEYSWAHAKGQHYRRMPLALKKQGRESFKQLVKESTSPVEQLTEERIRKFAARARAYICTYYCLANTSAAGASGGSNTSNSMVTEKQQLLYNEIERLMKEFKVHRCALDFDRGFVHAELKCAADNQR